MIKWIYMHISFWNWSSNICMRSWPSLTRLASSYQLINHKIQPFKVWTQWQMECHNIHTLQKPKRSRTIRHRKRKYVPQNTTRRKVNLRTATAWLTTKHFKKMAKDRRKGERWTHVRAQPGVIAAAVVLWMGSPPPETSRCAQSSTQTSSRAWCGCKTTQR